MTRLSKKRRCVWITGKKRRRRCLRRGVVAVYVDGDVRLFSGYVCAAHIKQIPEAL